MNVKISDSRLFSLLILIYSFSLFMKSLRIVAFFNEFSPLLVHIIFIIRVYRCTCFLSLVLFLCLQISDVFGHAWSFSIDDSQHFLMESFL